MAIIWEESLKIGVPIIDEQHEEIFSKFDELKQALTDGAALEGIVSLLNYLHQYAESHFTAEENLMKLYKYDGLDEQIQHHAQFKNNIKTLLEMLNNNVPVKEVAIRANATIIRYFIGHVRQIDSKMASFIRTADDAKA